ncbi:MAG: hypothetical protein ABW000_16795 [Actinoplanes sp.]
MSLSPEQRDGMRRLLEDELRTAWRAAAAEGATPDVLGCLVDRSLRAVQASCDSELPGGGVSEQPPRGRPDPGRRR